MHLFASTLSLFASTLHLFAPTLRLFASTLHLFASTLSLFASTLHLFASTLSLFAPTLHLFAPTLSILDASLEYSGAIFFCSLSNKWFKIRVVIHLTSFKGGKMTPNLCNNLHIFLPLKGVRGMNALK